jgi:1-aminocyclopropane-1-carboxylate deaminase/D-cysteine desulfhydrase-like pyridoxal-dependent ACC family enzyme
VVADKEDFDLLVACAGRCHIIIDTIYQLTALTTPIHMIHTSQATLSTAPSETRRWPLYTHTHTYPYTITYNIHTHTHTHTGGH